jgi:Fe-S cluster assembly protein SufD
LTAFTADRAATIAGPSWLRDRRAAAAERFATSELPTAADELWRYTPVGDLDLGRYTPVDAAAPVPAAPARSAVAAAVTDPAGVITIVDGRLAAVEMGAAATAAGVTVTSTAGPEADGAVELLDLPDPDALTALHEAFVPEIVVIEVPAGVAVERPIVVVQHVVTAGVAAFPHLLVRAGANAEVTVLDSWTSADVDAFVAPVVELQPGDGAHVRYVGVQEFGPSVWSTGHLVARPGRDGNAKAWFVALGGSYARLYVDAGLTAQGASAEISGVYFGDGDQTLDFRSLQDHVGSRSASNFLLKGAVVDHAHGVYTGLIRVHEGAKATESFLSNRNLVLDDGAHVDSVPNLEILNENDIRSCGHAAATGPVDEEHRFYLESRGVPTEVAERLIVFGFFDDVVTTIPVDGVVDPLRLAVGRKLSHV